MQNPMTKLHQGIRLLGILLGGFALLIGIVGIVGYFRYSHDSTNLSGTLFALTMFVSYSIYGGFLLVPFRILRRGIPIWVFALLSLVFCVRVPFGFAAVAPLGENAGLIAFWSGTLIVLSISQLVIFAGNRIPEQDASLNP